MAGIRLKSTKWLNTMFVSSSSKTEQFMAFASDWKSDVKKVLKDYCAEIKFSVGHFYISGFARMHNGTIIYFSISDVRFFPDEWYNHVLIRTATSFTDYTGGSNHCTTLKDMGEAWKNL